jgi:uncharacterized protein YfdQ (DUF2303 family)
MSEEEAVREGTEADAVAELAVLAATPVVAKPGDVVTRIVTVNGQLEITDFEFLLDKPRRKHGEVRIDAPESFCSFVDRHSENDTLVYAHLDSVQLVAVFNDAAADYAGWADHRALMTLQTTPEWKRWVQSDGKLMNQGDFAEFIEDGSLEIVEPDAATMLELAQTFEAKTNVEFKSSTILESGQRRLDYEETIAAKAGTKGQIEIPKELTLGLSPFVGVQPFSVTARLPSVLGRVRRRYREDRHHRPTRAAPRRRLTQVSHHLTNKERTKPCTPSTKSCLHIPWRSRPTSKPRPRFRSSVTSLSARATCTSSLSAPASWTEPGPSRPKVCLWCAVRREGTPTCWSETGRSPGCQRRSPEMPLFRASWWSRRGRLRSSSTKSMEP